MGRLVRKSLMLDPEKVRALAGLHGTSEAEAVRRAIDRVLLADEVTLALREIREQGGIDDVFGRVTKEQP